MVTRDRRLQPSDLAGLHVALATPVQADGNIDRQGLVRLLQHVAEGRVDAVCPTGSTGEGPRLTRFQRLGVTRAVVNELGPDRVIIPAASALTVAEAIDEITQLSDAGAAAVLLAPPCYYPMPPPDQVAWFRAVADAAPIPLVLYNIPAMTKVSLTPDAVATLAQLPNVIGMKDSSRDLEYLQHVVLAIGDADFAVVTGTDTLLLASLGVGAVGTIAASANVVPRLCRTVFDAYRRRNRSVAESAQRRLVAVVDACRVGTPPAGWKAALAWAGICSADLVPPAAGLDADQRHRLATQLETLDLR